MEQPKLYPSSPEHTARLKAAFPFQGYIQLTEHRAITFKQLQNMMGFAAAHCSDWHDTSPPAYSKTAGEALNIEMVNLYHLNAWLIKPSTATDDCAFVELLTGEKQVPKWFISHWWGERIVDFVKCVAAHIEVRQLPEGVTVSSRDWPPRAPRTEALNGSIVDDFLDEHSAFWVCAYANRQHSLQNELVDNPKATSFFRAMQLSIGVLLILNDESDNTAAATAFSRIWCAFEEATCITQTGASRMLFDIAAVSKNGKGQKEAHILADGIAAIDSAMPKYAPEFKRKRERRFPVEVVAEGLQVQLETAQASQEVDRMRILNCIAERDLNIPPLTEHENYKKVNRILRATFAVAAWNHALGRSTTDKDFVKELQLPEILAADIDRKALHMDFKGYENFLGDGDVAALARGIPPGLRELRLEFQQCDGFTDEGVVRLAEKLPHTIEVLALGFLYCSVGDVSVVALADNMPAQIDTLDLNFGNCVGITDSGVAALANKLPSGLNELTLSFALCTNVTDAGLMALAGKLPPTTQRLVLVFVGCSQLTDVAITTLAKSIPRGVKNFRASFANCDKISDESAASFALELPSLLMDLHLHFAHTQVAEPREWSSLQELRNWHLEWTRGRSVGATGGQHHTFGMEARLLAPEPQRCFHRRVECCALM